MPATFPEASHLILAVVRGAWQGALRGALLGGLAGICVWLALKAWRKFGGRR